MKFNYVVLSIGVALSACVVRVSPGLGIAEYGEIVTMEPPAERVEVVGVAPSANHVWIRGHWVWRNGWVWAPGIWEVVRHGHHWEHGHWMRHRHGWVWVEGRWIVG